MVAEVKKELRVVVRNRTFTFSQLDAALAECSYLVNQRPMQFKPGPGGEDGYLCPNDILMGRSDKSPVIEPFEATPVYEISCTAVLGEMVSQLLSEAGKVSQVASQN